MEPNEISRQDKSVVICLLVTTGHYYIVTRFFATERAKRSPRGVGIIAVKRGHSNYTKHR